MTTAEERKVLATGCVYYKKEFEKAQARVFELESQVNSLKTQGCTVTSVYAGEDITSTHEFKELARRTKEFKELTEAEKEKAIQESKVLLSSMAKLSQDLNNATEANSNLTNENSKLKDKIADLLAESKDDIKGNSSEVVQLNAKVNELTGQIKDFDKERESLEKKIAELESRKIYKEEYDEATEKIEKLENELAIARQSANMSTVIDDDADDSMLLG